MNTTNKSKSRSTINKVVGVGLSKTGTSTLDICLEYLGFGPHLGYDSALSSMVESGDSSKAIQSASSAGFLEDSPWFLLYEEMDRAYPGSKFILTTRKSTQAHANSNWQHTLRKGQREQWEKEASFERTIKRYENHNRAVRAYFANRPNDLLEVCWENNDGWEKICPFLRVDIPLIPFPHANAKPTSLFSPIAKRLRRKKIYVARMHAGQLGRKLLAGLPNSKL